MLEVGSGKGKGKSSYPDDWSQKLHPPTRLLHNRLPREARLSCPAALLCTYIYKMCLPKCASVVRFDVEDRMSPTLL
jgi:hypothetical protein